MRLYMRDLLEHAGRAEEKAGGRPPMVAELGIALSAIDRRTRRIESLEAGAAMLVEGGAVAARRFPHPAWFGGPSDRAGEGGACACPLGR